MSKLVTIFGGSGFVGRYIARRIAKEGWRVRVAVRRPNEALFVKTYGVVGQVVPVFANIRDDASIAAAVKGADAVVNCVGILNESGKNTFQAIQADGAARIAQLTAAEGISRLVHLSAIGADSNSDSAYAKSKAAGEEAVFSHVQGAMVLRPSIVFGPEDQFFNRFAAMARMGPVLPVVGPETKFQPVYVDDVAAAAVKGIVEERGGVYELGGPDVESFHALMQRMLNVINRRALIVKVPYFAAIPMAQGLDIAQRLSLGVFTNGLLTRDQVRQLARDNVVSAQAQSFADLGIKPTSMDTILETYLWRFRRGGQYAEITASARELKD